jgi:transcriptional regulator with XRE-family HTH domain
MFGTNAMTPRQARGARAMLCLDLKEVCGLASVGKRTLTEFEAGKRKISTATQLKLEAFYISQGLAFDYDDGEGVKFVYSAEANKSDNLQAQAKLEYLDIVQCFRALEHYEKISLLIDQHEETNISKQIATFALKRSGLIQKEFAQEINLSPQFLNAILVGNKKIPVGQWPRFQPYLPQEFEGTSILKLERNVIAKQAILIDCVNNIKRLLDKMRFLQGKRN